MAKFKINLYFIEVVLILILGLIPLLWYRDGTVALGHDMGFPLAPVDYFKDRLYAWSDRIGSFGSNQTDSISGIFIHGLEALFSSIGFSLVHTQQINFIIWFILPGITMYILLRSLYPQKEDFVIRISGSLFYMLNHYLLQAWLIAERTKFSIVAVLPLLVLIIINVIVRRRSILQQSIVLTIILFFLNGGAGIPLWGGLLIVGGCTLTLSLLHSSEKWINKLLRAGGFILLTTLFLFLVNLYWIYPYTYSFAYNYTQRVQISGGIEGIIGWSREISRNASFINILRMQGIPEWYSNQFHPYAKVLLDNPIFIFLSIFFPVIAMYGLIKSYKENITHLLYARIFLTILVIGIPFTAGSHPPFGVIYDFFLKELPGFSIFRTPFYKFGMVLWFAYSFLIALGLNYVVNLFYEKVKLSKLKLKFIVLTLFIVMLALYNYPFFTGNFFQFSKDFSTMVKVPTYVFDAKKILDNNKFSTRTLLLPELNNSNFQVRYSWEYFSLSTIPSMFSRSPVVINDVILVNSPERKLVEGLYEHIKTYGTSPLIPLLGINSVLVQNDLAYQTDVNFSPQKTLVSFMGNSEFAEIEKLGEWSYYEYLKQDVKPLISATDSISYLSVSSSDLSKSFEVPNVSLAHSFIWQDPKSSFNPQFLENSSNLVLQALCSNCPRLQASYSSEFLVPRILPGTRFYPIAKALEEKRRSEIADPAEIIEYDLIGLSKRAGALWVLVKDYRNTKVVPQIINEWMELLHDINIAYNQLPEPHLKDHYSRKIYYLIRDIIFRNEDLIGEDRKEYLLDEDSKKALNQFREDAQRYIESVGLSPIDIVPAGTPSRYKLYIPREDKYQISLFSGQEYITKENKLTLKVNNQDVSLNKAEKKGWYISDFVSMAEGQTVIDFPLEDSHFKDLAPVKDFKIEALPGRSDCIDIPIGKIDPRGDYLIKFGYEVSSGAIPFFYYFMEVNDDYPNGRRNEIFGDGRAGYERDKNISVFYKPSELAENVFMRFCADSLEREPANINIKKFKFLANSPNSTIFITSLNKPPIQKIKLEFVSLNQTKYFVRVADIPNKWFIDFNSRFDSNWQIRQVDSQKADQYFKGQKKEYLVGQISEYEKNDQHILTDFIFPFSGESNQNHIYMNSFSNGWYMNTNEQEIPLTFLIEYRAQNDLYKVSAISLVSVLILFSIYIWRKLYERFSA